MTIAEWPETDGRRPVGDRQPPRLRPSPRLYSRSVCLSSSRDAVGCLVNCSGRVVRKNALTYLVNDTVVFLIMAEDFSDISDGEVVCATQLVEELYGDDATDADLLAASQQFDIASKSVRDTSVSMCKTTERPCASPLLSEEEFEELKRSGFPKKTVDQEIWAVTVFGDWRGQRNVCSLSNSSMVYLDK